MLKGFVHGFKRLKQWCCSRRARFGMETCAGGISYYPFDGREESPFIKAIDAPDLLLPRLQKLRQSGHCAFINRRFHLTWKQVYSLIQAGDPVLLELLHLNSCHKLRLSLRSTGRLGHTGFNIRLSHPSSGYPRISYAEFQGTPAPVATDGRLLSLENFRLMEDVAAFQRLTPVERGGQAGESKWGEILYSAKAADADVSDFVTSRVCLSLETLRMVLSLPQQKDALAYVELVPYFTGAPFGWRAAFLDSTELPEVYLVSNRKTLAQVDVDVEVRPLVLEARRLAGRSVTAQSTLARHLQIIDQTDLEDMSPEAFEYVCALIYRKHGFTKSFRVGGSGDGGVDVVCLRGSQGLLLQCKSSKELDKRLGWEGVKDVVAGEAGYRIKHPFVTFQKMSLTNQYFNESAKSQAALNNVVLMDKTSLLKEIRRLHISYLELRFFSKGAV